MSDNIEFYQVILILVGYVAIFLFGLSVAMSLGAHWLIGVLSGVGSVMGFSAWFSRRLD